MRQSFSYMNGLDDIKNLRESGKYPVMDLSIFDSLNELNIDDWNQEIQYDLLKKYKQVIEVIMSFDQNKRDKFLKAIKIQDIIDSQTLEKKDPYLISVGLNWEGIRKTGIQYLINNCKDNKNLTNLQVKNAHKYLLKGTDNDYESSDSYRDSNDIFVSKSGYSDELKIHYFPIDYTLIDQAMNQLLDYYNSEKDNNEIIAKPIIIHGLVAALQMFKDGNTRLARLLQTIKIYDLTNKTFDEKLTSPVLYASNMYKSYRDQYRDIIGDIAIDSNDDVWNKWLRFNFFRMDEQLNETNHVLKYHR